MDGAYEVGTTIGGRYALDTRLGVGTFGEVWRAKDENLSGRAVAVKLLKPEYLANTDLVTRFEGEANALAHLSHHNVVNVLDRGAWNGTRYIVMELVDGMGLDFWLHFHERRGSLPDLKEVRALFDGICAGMEAAHGLAVVHRDLKPANVMLAKASGKNPQIAKIVDFGIARLGTRQQTQSGITMGTPEYMAPEQGAMEPDKIGTWTDVFALGVILVEMLTLRPSVEQGERLWLTVMRGKINVGLRLRDLRGDVPAAVWDVVAAALLLDHGERLQTAGRFREALENAWPIGELGLSIPMSGPRVSRPGADSPGPSEPKDGAVPARTEVEPPHADRSPESGGGRVLTFLFLAAGVALVAWLVFGHNDNVAEIPGRVPQAVPPPVEKPALPPPAPATPPPPIVTPSVEGDAGLAMGGDAGPPAGADTGPSMGADAGPRPTPTTEPARSPPPPAPPPPPVTKPVADDPYG